MSLSSVFAGSRPGFYAWAAGYGILISAVVIGYALATPGSQLPTTALGYASLAIEVLVRALIVAELTRVVRAGSMPLTRKTQLLTLVAILACGTMFLTWDLDPDPLMGLVSVVGLGFWAAAHRRISERLEPILLMAQPVSWQARAAIIGSRPRPQWMQALDEELRRDPNYRDQH